MTADATPGGEPQRSLRSLALPLASAGAARHSKAGVCSDKPAGDDLSSEKTYSVRAPSDSFYFAKSEIVESLLRRGARVSYPDEQELASSRPGSASAAGARPKGVLLA